MKKIETIVETCEKCRFCQDFTRYHENIDHAFICMESKRVIEIQKRGHPKEEAKRPCILPDWCPLETYKDAEKSEAQPETIPCYIGQSKADEKSPLHHHPARHAPFGVDD